jgi:ABC-type sulfate/molybdate transport systems ATPase subunit
VLVTHDIELAARVTDRIIFLEDGIVKKDGPTAEILSDSNFFGTQISKIFPRTTWITVNDALGGLGLTHHLKS